MNWFTLLKQPELRTGSKVTTNLGIDSKEEDDSCERKLREYVNKLGNKKTYNTYYRAGYTKKDSSFVDEGIPEEVYCEALKIINKVLDEILDLEEKFYGFNSDYVDFKDKNGYIWFVACEVFTNNMGHVEFVLQVDTQHSPTPHPNLKEIYIVNSVKLKLIDSSLGWNDDDNIDYARAGREIDFR